MYIDISGDKRIEITRAILNAMILIFSEKFEIQFSHIFIFANIKPESHGISTVSSLCRSQPVPKIHVPIYPYLISEERRNCSTL